MTATLELSGAAGEDGHICLVVDDDHAYAELARRFLCEGEVRREKTVAFGPQDSPDQGLLRQVAAMAADPYLDVLAGGNLDPERMFAMFRRETAKAREEGYHRLRVAADMDWLLPATRSWEDALRFEVQLDRVVAELDATVMCAYRRSSFSPEAISGVLSTHPLTAGHGEDAPLFKLIAGDEGCWILSGELDVAGSPLLLPALTATAGDPWVVDSSELTFADVSGMRAIAMAALDSGRTLRVRGATERFRRHWRLAGFDRATTPVVLEN